MPKQIKWNLTDMFKNDTDPAIAEERARIEKATQSFVDTWRERTDYLDDPAILAKALEQYEDWKESFGYGGKLAYYFSLRLYEDQNDKKVLAKNRLIDDFVTEQVNLVRFFELNIAKIPEETQKNLLEDSRLAHYHHFLRRQFVKAQYQLSDKEESILTLTASPAYQQWVDMLESFLTKEERTILNEDQKNIKADFSTIINLIDNRKKKVRDTAAAAFNDILAKHVDTAEAEINAVLSYRKTIDLIRKTPRPDTTRHLVDDMDTEVVDTVVEAVSARNQIAQDFYRLKAELLGVKKLAYHERNIEYGSIEKRYSWDEGFELVDRVFQRLHPDFAKILRDFRDEGRFDVFPRKGKSSGAFCAYYLISLPVYVLLNYAGTLQDILTLAHEMGHAINDELIRRKQSALYFGTSTATAEVASTFMEDFVIEELLNEADDDLRLSLNLHKLNQDVSAIFRQIAFYQFEQELHAKVRSQGYLPKEEIGEIFQRYMHGYMGDSVEQSPGSENWWVYVGHFRKFFYVYTYASGLLISKSLQQQVRADNSAIEQVHAFLSTGLSESPKETFSKMGIDMTEATFWDKGLDGIKKQLDETRGLAKRLGKVKE
ncbi:MAG: M3 family oligoendopeptidase [Patescibacteria group bacterium]